MFDLTDKIVVITGGAGLLGKKHAEAVAEFGAIPVILDLSQKKAEDTAFQIKEKYKVDSLGLAVDITSEQQAFQSCEQLLQKFKKIDVLINNAANNPKVEESKVR